MLCNATTSVWAQDTSRASGDASRIARVTVYPGSATVERVAKVPARVAGCAKPANRR
jgi:hypothetical protein